MPAGAALVIATPGAEPVADGGYGAAVLLDGWALLGRADLRAGEEALRRWLNAAALVRPAAQGGRVVVLADSSLRPVQALIRWDPAGHAERELAERVAVGFPPAVTFAELVGAPAAVAELLDATVTAGQRRHPRAATGRARPQSVTATRRRMMCVHWFASPRTEGAALASALARSPRCPQRAQGAAGARAHRSARPRLIGGQPSRLGP